MLLEKQHDAIQSAGLGAGNTFQIAASAKAFEILSSNLYQNKILAVIRELSCNAADANKAAGHPTHDFFIQLPTYSSPYFKVRDKGPGLSDADVRHLYTTYFASTKDGSNDYIGGFGLGSKSPFAVVDQFTIVSWHGGRRRTYVCFKDGGVPNINAISDVASDEPTGLEVQMAVPSGTTRQWAAEAAGFFRWWPVPPRGIEGHRYMLHDDDIGVKSADVHADGRPYWAIMQHVDNPIALMGGVPYNIRMENVVKLPPEIVSTFGNAPVILSFNVGELQISPSREELSYDPATCAALTDRLRDITKTLSKQIEAQLASCTSLYEARNFVYGAAFKLPGLHKSAAGKMLGALTWQGKPVTKAVKIASLQKDFAAPIGVTTYVQHGWRRTWDKNTQNWDYLIQVIDQDAPEFVWAPAITAKTYATLKHARESKYPGRGNGKLYYILTGSTFADVSTKLHELGFPPIRDIASYPAPPKTISNSSRAAATKTTAYTFQSDGGYANTESALDLTLAAGTLGFFVEFEKGHPNEVRTYHIKALADMVADGKPYVLIGLAKRRLVVLKLQAALAKHGWTKLTYERVKEVALDKLEHQGAREASPMLRWGDRANLFYIISWLASQKSATPTDFVFKQLIQESIWMAALGIWNSGSLPTEIANQLTPEQQAAYIKGTARYHTFKAHLSAFTDAHPLLKRITFNDGEVTFDAVNDYINRS